MDGGQGIAGQGHHILYRDHIRVFAQQLFIVAVHLPQRVLRQLLGEPRHIVGAVPALRRRVEFREDRPLLQICFHILFSDFIAPGFLTRPLAGHLAAFEQVQRRGLADVADSFCAVKKLVFEEKAFTMRQLVEALQHDFQGYEDIRVQLLKDAPKYGNNDPYVDEIARKILTYFCDEVGQYRNLRGGVFVPGQYSNSANVPFGEDCGATPNGRHAHTPIAEACSPSHGSEKNGPTQAALSVAHLDHVLVTNGTQYNQKYHPNALKGEKGIASLAALIKTFFEAGGFHIQFNVVSAETLRKAQKEPEKYRDLVVRVAGYTAFFVDLNKAIQDDIIDRTEMSF